MTRDIPFGSSAVLYLGLFALLTFGACTPGEDDPDILGPLQSTGLALSSSGTGSSGLAVSVDGSRSQVWSVERSWSDTDGAAGMAWPADSGLSWEEKYNQWVQKMASTPIHGSTTRNTFVLTSPFGKELPIAYLECAELAMTLRVLFASWYQLPFYLSAVDSNGQRLYAGHFGFRTAAGRYRNTPEFRVRYDDFSGLTLSDALASWPEDAKLRDRNLYGGGSDINAFLGDEAGAGYYFDEVLLNKRVGHFLAILLPYFGSINLADDANSYHVEAEGVRAGDILLKRWQKRGIGHVMVVKQVDPAGAGKLQATIVSGSMPRRQGVWESPAASKIAFTNPYTGGEGENRDGDSYVKLGGGLKRFLAPQKHNGKWRQRVLPADMGEFIQWSDQETRAARPARFEELLGEPDPETLRDELLDAIEAKREHLRKYPASCSARSGREQAFELLYTLMETKFPSPTETAPLGMGWTRDQVDEEFRILDDYVFAELVYNESKTCCWNSSTSDMYEIIMDYANQQAQESPCTSPPVFMNTNGGYYAFSSHATELDRGGEWVSWSADESCPQGDTLNDVEQTHGWTPWCEIMAQPGSGNSVPGEDPFEPNDSREQAFEIEAGTYEDTAISAGDEDWFTFTPPTDAMVRVTITFDGTAGNLDLAMFRGDEEVDTATGATDDEETVDSRYDGIEPLYVRVYGVDGAQAGYRLQVEFEGGIEMGPPCNSNNNTMEDAIRVGNPGTFNELSICADDPVDWYRVSATVGAGTIRIEFSHTEGDLDMELYRSNGETIVASNSTSDDEELESPGSVRFLKVYGYSGATAAYRLVVDDE